MEISESILISIKKLLGIDESYTHFDPDIIIHINSVFSILTQMGVGPANGFSISGKDEVWSGFIQDKPNIFSLVKSYVYMKVRLLFDPPLSSAAIESINRQISEFEWRLFVAADPVKNTSGKVEKSEINGNIKINGQETVVYTHPAGSAVEAGFKKVGSDASGHVVLGDDVTKEDITKLGIPGQDTTYEKATSEADGLMSKEDKAKLDGMAVAEDTEVQSMLDEIFGATEEEP